MHLNNVERCLKACMRWLLGPISCFVDWRFHWWFVCTCRETAHLAVRMLTARAAGMVLRNISQVDSFKAEWMEEYFTKV